MIAILLVRPKRTVLSIDSYPLKSIFAIGSLDDPDLVRFEGNAPCV